MLARAKASSSALPPPTRTLTRPRSTLLHGAACGSGTAPNASTRHFARDTSSATLCHRRHTLSEAVVAGKRRLPPGLETQGGTSFVEADLDDASSVSEADIATLRRRQISRKRQRTLDRCSGLGADGSALDVGGLSYLKLESVQPKSEAIYREEMSVFGQWAPRSTSAKRRTPLWRRQS